MNTVTGNEIITIGVGQCGIMMLNEFISTIRNEHKIDRDGKFTGNWNNTNDKLIMLKNNVYFNNHKKHNRYTPRSIFIDKDKTYVNKVKSSYLGSLICEDHFISTSFAEPSLIWPKGHYTEGEEMIDDCMDAIRRDVEICDMIQGFQIFHSVVGGWGSGFGTLLLLKIRDNYRGQCTNTFTMYQSICRGADNSRAHNDIFATYNTILSIHQLIENSDMCYTFGNVKLIDFAKNQCNLEYPTYDDLNWLLSLVLSGTTSTLRFQCEPTVNVTLKRYNVCFCPFPRLHFLALYHSPFFSNKKNYQFNDNVGSIIVNLLNKNDVSNVDLKLEDGKMLNVAFVYRGNDDKSVAKLDEYISTLQYKMSDDFVEWIPSNVQSSFIYDGNNEIYKKYSPIICTALVSTTAIKSVFEMMSRIFAWKYSRKVFLWRYKDEGMDEMEFQEAHKNLKDLITEYWDKQDVVIDTEEDEYSDSV